MDNNNNVNSDKNEVKTFTQDEVNKMMSERVARVKAEKEQEYTEKLAELQRQELQLRAKESLMVNGLPESLLDVVNCPDIDTFNKNIEVIKNYMAEVKAAEPIQSFVPGQGDSILDAPDTADSIGAAFGLSAYMK